ncbi:30S ribosomal protein S3 [Flavobacteriaceae bacterium]|nr:30S ribosomal protein S3 [Flavobacteriaceae bacterium]
MAQKVNPVGYRLLTNKNWKSIWYDNKKTYAEKLIKDLEIRKFIMEKYVNCGIGGVAIERQSDKLNLIIKTSKPGIIIGKKGLDIEKINNSIQNISGCKVDIKILEIDKPDLSALIVAGYVAKQLESRASFKRVVKKMLQSTMKQGAHGIKICCSGRLGGAEIARSESYHNGSVPLHTLRKNIDYATAIARTTYGAIGIKVWINKGEVK